ncbi:MAG TPA: HIT domain-containing protein [Patescibacteria group bacterium]|nr:HIT domain-containing protein [Patescibacteria group bacterium]
MALIYETPHFIIESAEQPFVSREEGGHIRIMPKVKVEDRTKLSPELAKELMKFSMIVGEAMKVGMEKCGVELGRINYQDMGNWGPTLHLHIFGRAKTAIKQKFGEAVSLPKRDTGFYDTFKPLDEKDRSIIKQEIEKLVETEKYKNF